MEYVFDQLMDSTDLLQKFKAIMSGMYWRYTRELIIYTRSYDQGLVFVDRMSQILETYKDQFTPDEYESFDRMVIGFRLTMLDKADRWNRYVGLFEETIQNKPYTLTYSAGRDDPEFEKYVMGQEDKVKYVHFLFLQADRYEVIKRKIQRSAKSGREGPKHRKQSELSDEELKYRFDRIMSAAVRGDPIRYPHN